MARINGIKVEIPKHTLKIAELLERHDEIQKLVFNDEMKYTDALREYYEILGEILGAEQCAAVVAGDTIEEVDITKLLTAFVEIVAIYKEPIEKAKNEYMKKQFKDSVICSEEVKTLTSLVEKAGM